VGGVERVQHVGQRDRVGRDLQVIGLVQAALILQGDVGDPGAGQVRGRRQAAPRRVPMRPGNDSAPPFVTIEQITTERTG
jgi:hypothetical protein